MMLVFIGMLGFLAVAFGAMAAVMEAQSKRMAERFTSVVSEATVEDVPEDLKAPFQHRVLLPLLLRAAEYAARYTPRTAVKTLTLQLDRAGRPWGMVPSVWILFRTASAGAGVLAALFAGPHLPIPPLLRLCAMTVIAGVGAMGPSFWLDSRIRQRQATIRRALPDVIDLLVVSVEAGLGLDAAVAEVLERRRGPLMDELARVLGGIRVGKSRRQAWQDMAARIDLLELKGFVAALVQGWELGASISTVLRGQSEAIRTRRSLHVREVAAVLPVKMLFPLIFFIFPAMFVVILGPGVIKLLSTFRQVGF
jgi:tight adherence protein C